MSIFVSCVIPAKSRKDPLLKDLIKSIKAQDFPKSKVEIIVVTEGDSEQAKAIGIRKAKGKYCLMLCCDNVLTNPKLFRDAKDVLKCSDVAYTRRYDYREDDCSLNRYFALVGCNDPIPFFLGKNDRLPYARGIYKSRGFASYGCNGTFVRRKLFKYADLDHYYPMDVHVDITNITDVIYRDCLEGIWHRTTTDNNLIKFLWKRYKYARDLHSDRKDRRWKVISGAKDRWRLLFFILSVVFVIPCLSTSLVGYIRKKDRAWFWHWFVSAGHLGIYGVLCLRNILKSASSFLRSAGKRV